MTILGPYRSIRWAHRPISLPSLTFSIRILDNRIRYAEDGDNGGTTTTLPLWSTFSLDRQTDP